MYVYYKRMTAYYLPIFYTYVYAWLYACFFVLI